MPDQTAKKVNFEPPLNFAYWRRWWRRHKKSSEGVQTSDYLNFNPLGAGIFLSNVPYKLQIAREFIRQLWVPGEMA